MKRSIFVVLAGALLLAVGLGAACGSSKDQTARDAVSALQTQVAQGSASSQNADIAAALTALAAANIHEFATSVEDGTLPAGESGPIQRALAAIAAVQWPSAIKSDADDMQAKLTALLNVLGTDDINQIKGPADDAHEANDAFPDTVYGYLAGQLGLPTPEGGVGETSTPMANETPGATATQ